MENFFIDDEDIQLLFKNSDMTGLIDLKEGDYSDSKEFDYAFTDAGDGNNEHASCI